MKNTFLKYIKISLVLVLLLQAGKVEAQTSCIVNGVTVTATGTSTDIYYAPNLVLCNAGNNAFTGSGAWTSAALNGTITYTFSKAVTSATVTYTSINYFTPNQDVGTFTTNSAGVLTLSNPCNVTIAGTKITAITNTSIANAFGDAKITVSSTVPFTTLTLTSNTAITGWIQGNLCNFDVTPFCNNAPTLSATTATAACPANTFNLNSLVTSTLPSGATLKWYSDTTHTTEVTTPTAVGVSGTYYAFYKDATLNCYSPASAAVTVTANCPINVATTCPDVSIDLASRVVSTVPSGYTITYHSGTPATNANKLTSSVVNTSGTYYLSAYFAAQDCYLNTGRPMVVTITNCCATVTPTWN